METLNLDAYLECDCAGKPEQICDLCQVIKPSIISLRARVAELEADYKSACAEADAWREKALNRPDSQYGINEALTLESRVAELETEVHALRLFGNKDCIAQADEYLSQPKG